MHIFYEFHDNPIIFFNDSALTDVPHLHQHIELIYMKKGTAIVDHLDTPFSLEEGDIFLALPNFAHKYKNLDPRSESEAYILLFHPLFFTDFHAYFNEKFLEDPIIKKDSLHKDVVFALQSINAMSETMLSVGRDSELYLLCKSYISLILAHLLPKERYIPDKTPSSGDIMVKAIKYIMDNFRSPISLDTLSKELGVSKSHISRTFNSKIDMGFSQYLNILRIDNAKDLLSTTDQPITEVGEFCGYETHRTFNREFKKITGLNPREYRDKYKIV